MEDVSPDGTDSDVGRAISDDNGLQQEVELLEAIYMDELVVGHDQSGRPKYIRIQLHPATGDDVDQRFVCLTLEFNLPSNYPDTVPDMTIRNPRGLADDHVTGLRESLREMAHQGAGMPMLFELIELVKESLTQSNVPHGQCVICLEYFAEGEPFTHTACYHYFHCSCLLRYVKHCQEEHSREQEEIRQHKHMTLEKKQVVCPVCREPISYDLDALRQQVSEVSETEAQITLSAEIRQLQRQMAALFQKQQAKGGIIDLEEERNKFLIPSEEQSSSVVPGAPVAEDEVTSPSVESDVQPSYRGQGRGQSTMTTSRQTEPHWKDRRDHRDHRHDRGRRGHGRERRRDERPRSGRNQERAERKAADYDRRDTREYNGRNNQNIQQDSRDSVVEKRSDRWQGQQSQHTSDKRNGLSDQREEKHYYHGNQKEETNKAILREETETRPKRQEVQFVHSVDVGRRMANGHQHTVSKPDTGTTAQSSEAKQKDKPQGNHREGGRWGGRWGGRGRGQSYRDNHRPRSGNEHNYKNENQHSVPDSHYQFSGKRREEPPHQVAPGSTCDAVPEKTSDNRRREPRRPHAPPFYRNDAPSSSVNPPGYNGENCQGKYFPPPPGFRRSAGPPPGFKSTTVRRSQPPPGFEERR